MMAKRIWVLIGTALVVLGLTIFVLAWVALGWDLSGAVQEDLTENEYATLPEFSSVSLDVDTADITFIKADASKVTLYEEKDFPHTVEVRDGVLFIEAAQRKWTDSIKLISVSSPRITVYLSEGQYEALNVIGSTGDVKVSGGIAFDSVGISCSTGDVVINDTSARSVKVETDTGDISVKGTEAHELVLNVSTGDVRAENVRCDTLRSEGSTGELFLSNTVASGMITLERSTGDISFNGCDAAQIEIITSTGDVEGTLLTAKSFDADSNAGDVDVPKNTVGGKCTVRTDTGDIKIRIG